MSDKVLIQIRIPRKLADKIDKLIDAGFFSSRSELVGEAIRRLILDYELAINEISFIVDQYLSGKLKRNKGIKDKIEINIEKAKKNLIEIFGSDVIEDAINIIRRRKI